MGTGKYCTGLFSSGHTSALISYFKMSLQRPQVSFEQPHDKTNKMTCAPNENSDQPGHPPNLIRVITVQMKTLWALNYLLSAQ